MYVSEDRVSELLDITKMQLRFILEADNINYSWCVKDGVYYINGNSLIKLQKDIKESQAEFKRILKEDYGFGDE